MQDMKGTQMLPENSEGGLHKEFLKSPHHLWLLFLTLGTGIATASILPAIVGAAAYALGVIYIPDMPFFRRWHGKRRTAAFLAEEQAKVTAFTARRDAIFSSLSDGRKAKYLELASVCKSINSLAESSQLQPFTDDPRARKLEELMWTYLKLLAYDNTVQNYIRIEDAEDLEGQLRSAEEKLAKLKEAPPDAQDESSSKLIDSKTELLEVLRKRAERYNLATGNLTLVQAEQERLEQQVKLIRADSMAMRSSDALFSRIDAAISHLEHTNKWLMELDELKSLDVDFPSTSLPVGFTSMPMDAAVPPQTRQKTGSRTSKVKRVNMDIQKEG